MADEYVVAPKARYGRANSSAVGKPPMKARRDPERAWIRVMSSRSPTPSFRATKFGWRSASSSTASGRRMPLARL